MLFHAAGAEGSRPTFFEMAAADFLPASLKAAALYALGVLAQHRPSLHRLLDHSDELSAAALLLLEWHSLKTHGASFGESMYGLRRISTVPHRPSPSQAALRTGATAGRAAGGAEGAGRGERAAGGQEGGSASYGMSRKQRALSLLFLVLLPYLRAKLHALFAISCSPTTTLSSLHYNPYPLPHTRFSCPTCAPSCILYPSLPIRLSTTPHPFYCTAGAAALPARQAACSVCCSLEAEAGPLFKSTQNTPYPLPHTTYQVLLPYLRAKLHALFAVR
ncbi:unnamed protein product [Closterium sp. NIES-65]|nr:unnamed protein product [Closterium sp. NIES-65]